MLYSHQPLNTNHSALTKMEPIIISVAPNGARKTKNDHPNIPLEIDEIAEDARQCAEAGATFLHMHIRDKNLGHTLDVETYRQAIKAVRAATANKMIIQVTSEAVGIYKPPEQMKMVMDLRPESVSLSIREIIPKPDYENTAKEFFTFLNKEEILPQFILYDTDDVKYFSDLRKREIIPQEKVFVLFVLGKKSGIVKEATVSDLDPFLECFADGYLKLADTVWSVTAFGKNELAIMKKTIECGGHPRIGFENNQLIADGSTAENNAALVKQLVKTISESGRKLADITTTRHLL